MKISTIRYFSMDALTSLKRNKTLSLASVITVSLTLFIFGVFLLTMFNANKVLKNMESKLEVSLYLKEDILVEDKQDIESAIKNIKGVSEVVYITKDDALNKFKDQLGKENEYLAEGFDKKNPLPESFVVKIEDSKVVKDVVEKSKSIKGIQKVVANEYLVDQISKLTKSVKWIGIVALLIMIPVSLFLIGNTIKLAVYSRRKEINTMKFVGATDWFIRWPFVIEGIVIGLAGSIVSSVILYTVYKIVYKKLSAVVMLNLITPSYFSMNILWIFILSGILIGGIGSILSMRKFLKV